MSKKKKVSQSDCENIENIETVAEPAETENAEDQAEIQPDKNEKLENYAKKCEEYLAAAQRVQADFDNYRRRNEAAKALAYADGTSDALCAMLPVMDNFERVIGAIPEGEANKAMLDGIVMVKKQLETVLSGKGISEIPSGIGEAFDPNLHNAVMTAALSEGATAGTIAATFQKGYKMNEKVIRYAMVSVFNE